MEREFRANVPAIRESGESRTILEAISWGSKSCSLFFEGGGGFDGGALAEFLVLT